MKIKPCYRKPILNPCSLEDLNYQIDPYIGCEHYCYYCYVLPQAETDWRKEVLVHEDIIGRLKKELSAIPPQTIYMGWHTDPYQPCEAEYHQTREVLELLLENGFSASILTKSDLVLRDIDLLQSMDNAAISVSVAFNDEEVRKMFEAKTKETAARISALEKLKAADIKTASLICPVIPHITDVKLLLDWLAEYADTIWIYGLSILNPSDPNWQNIEQILETHFPDLKEQIETVIFSRDHLYWQTLKKELLLLQKQHKLDLRIQV